MLVLPLPVRVVVGLLFLFALAACPKDQPNEAKPSTEPSEQAALQRPPFPNMATAAWGSRVLDEEVDEADPTLSGKGYQASLEAALAALHSLEPGSEARLKEAALSAYRAAMADPERATAAALFAAALVLDPAPEGYKERLTDAHGVAAFAGTFEQSSVLGQAARAFVAIAAGRVFDGQKLVDVLSVSERLDPDTRLFLGLSRILLGQRGDSALSTLRAVLKDKPESTRARAALAEALLDLGMSGEAVRLLDEPGARPHPWLDAIRGRALVLEGKVDEGIALLREAEKRQIESRRGQVLYWLGRSLTARKDGQGEAEAALATLSGRPGYEREAALLDALLAQKRGDFARARRSAESVCKARGLPLGLALDCQWAIVDACAGLGDVACVDDWGRRAVGTDGNRARLEHARAALVLIGQAKPDAKEGLDVDAALKRAHLLSPFDPGLGQRVGVETVDGGEPVAALLRAARRAVRLGALDAASAALETVAKERPACRVCRAVFALAARDHDEAAQRAVRALEGKGPPLAEADLIDLIEAMAGSAHEGAQKHLEKLAKSPRPRVREAARRALVEEGAKGAKAEPPAPFGTVPVPSLAAPPEEKNP